MNTPLDYQPLEKHRDFQQTLRAIKARLFTWQALLTAGLAASLLVASIIYGLAAEGDTAEMLFTLAGIVVAVYVLVQSVANDRMKKFAKRNGFTFKTRFDPRTPEEGIMGGSYAFNAATDDYNQTATQPLWQISGQYAGTAFSIGVLSIYRRYPRASSDVFKEIFAGVVKIDTKASLPTLLCRSKPLEAGMTVFDSSLIHVQPDWHFAPLGTLADARYSIYAPQEDPAHAKPVHPQVTPFLKALAATLRCDVEFHDSFVVLYIPKGVSVTPEGMRHLFSIISLANAHFGAPGQAGPRLHH